MKKTLLITILSIFLTFSVAFAGGYATYMNSWTITVSDCQTTTVYEDCRVTEENGESITFITGDRKVYKIFYRNHSIVFQKYRD